MGRLTGTPVKDCFCSSPVLGVACLRWFRCLHVKMTWSAHTFPVKFVSTKPRRYTIKCSCS